MDKKQIDLYCIDCGKWTRQNFKGIMPDNTELYQCETCGCENSIDIEEE